MKDKIKLEGLLNTPAIRQKERERVSGNTVKIPSNYERVMKDGIIKQEEIDGADIPEVNSDLQAEIEELKAENESLQAEIEELKAENESLQAEIEELKASSKKISGDKKEIKERIESLESENESLKADLKEMLDKQEVTDGSTSDSSEE